MEGLYYIFLAMVSGSACFSMLMWTFNKAKECWGGSNFGGVMICIIIIPLLPILFLLIILMGGLALEVVYMFTTGQI